jgi:hypothetical protein
MRKRLPEGQETDFLKEARLRKEARDFSSKGKIVEEEVKEFFGILTQPLPKDIHTDPLPKKSGQQMKKKGKSYGR